MNREQAKELLPIIQALAEGKHIQLKDRIGNWMDIDFINVELCNPNVYRIKPEPKYHPFANAEECWQEMKKHEPFGWVKDKGDGYNVMITKVNDDEKTDNMSINGNGSWDFQAIMHYYTFADGTPFGIKEE